MEKYITLMPDELVFAIEDYVKKTYQGCNVGKIIFDINTKEPMSVSASVEIELASDISCDTVS